MSYYETDTQVLRWFERALSHPAPRIRCSALELLCKVDCLHRERWLREGQADPHQDVAALAVLVGALAASADTEPTDLFESDFAEGLSNTDLRWEWEYHVAIAHEVVLQGCTHQVWTTAEDDGIARQLALHKAYVGKLHEASAATAIIVDKRLVNQFTRSPRSISEARLWGEGGRPRYQE